MLLSPAPVPSKRPSGARLAQMSRQFMQPWPSAAFSMSEGWSEMTDKQRDDNAERAVTAQDATERRALLLHFGDVVESIGCVLKCVERHKTIGEAAANEDSLAGFSLLGLVAPELTPHDYAARAATAFFLWTKELLEPTLNRKLMAYTVQHDLFADNQAGWDSYVELMRGEVPWFGEELGPVGEAETQQTSRWPPVDLPESSS
jgi:hypothetical protein